MYLSSLRSPRSRRRRTLAGPLASPFNSPLSSGRAGELLCRSGQSFADEHNFAAHYYARARSHSRSRSPGSPFAGLSGASWRLLGRPRRPRVAPEARPPAQRAREAAGERANSAARPMLASVFQRSPPTPLELSMGLPGSLGGLSGLSGLSGRDRLAARKNTCQFGRANTPAKLGAKVGARRPERRQPPARQSVSRQPDCRSSTSDGCEQIIAQVA